MILKHSQIFDNVQTLAQCKDEKGLLGYAIAVNLRRLSGEIVEFSHKRDELLVEYGTDQGGGRYGLTPDAAVAFQKALQPFGEVTADVQVMQVEPAVFYGGNLTSGQMFALAWMVKGE